MINSASIMEWKEQVPWKDNRYMAFTVENPPTYKQFVNNMEAKMTDEEFLGDTMGLLRPEMSFEPLSSYQLVKETLIDRLQ